MMPSQPNAQASWKITAPSQAKCWLKALPSWGRRREMVQCTWFDKKPRGTEPHSLLIPCKPLNRRRCALCSEFA